AIPEGIDLGVRPPCRRQVEFVINRLHGAYGLTRSTIDTFIWIDVEFTILPSVKMYTRHRADAHARLVYDINAGFSNHEGHAPHLPFGLRWLCGLRRRSDSLPYAHRPAIGRAEEEEGE